MIEAVCAFLEDHGTRIAGRARNGDEALAMIEARRPDVALVDLRMPRLSGIELTRRVARSAPSTAVVLYTAYGERAHLLEAMDAGARGFVLKEAPLTDLGRAIDTVAAGGVYVDPVLASVFARSGATDNLLGLTEREREVLRMLADGLTNDDIGRRLFLSPETVRTYVRKAMRKLEADTRTQAVAKALRQSLIS